MKEMIDVVNYFMAQFMFHNDLMHLRCTVYPIVNMSDWV